jgi:hypothetical protein
MSESARLRPSQLETLRAVPRFDGGESTAAHTGAYTCRSLRGESQVLGGLEALGLVEKTGRRSRRGSSFYRLTNQGRAALQERTCEHDWVDPSNDVVDANGLFLCKRCGALQERGEQR